VNGLRHFGRALLLVSVVVVCAACVGNERAGSTVQVGLLEDSEQTTYEYLVPLGTGARLDDGEVIELMPAVLDVRVGESIRIVNDDIRDFRVGPFFVAAGQRLAMRFTHPGELSGECAIGAGGQFVIIVSE